MKYICNIVYLMIVLAISPWVLWRVAVQGKNRRGWFQKLFGMVPIRNSSNPCLWIHAVSVGEINLLAPFVEQFRGANPTYDVVISTTTETGFDLANNRFPEEMVFFCPVDFTWAIKNTIHRIKPDLLLLTELELWPNLVSISAEQGIDVALINGRLGEKSFRGYMKIRFLVTRILDRLDLALMQTKPYANRIVELGMPTEKVVVSGNIKFDCANIGSDKSRTNRLVELANIRGNEFVFLAGSTQENEDLMAISVYQQLKPHHPGLRLILVPRHPDRCSKIVDVLTESKIPVVRRSELPTQQTDQPVVIVDVIGELKDWWGRADVGYVGGSMGSRGGQNMIEPAATATPICFGPNTDNFKDVVKLLLGNNAAHVVTNANELIDFVEFAIADQVASREMGQRAQKLVAQQRGATATTLACVNDLINARRSFENAVNRAA